MANFPVLASLIKSKVVVVLHAAPTCQSQSWGRLPALRSWEFPNGLPGLMGKQLELVLLGNAVAEVVFDLCLLLSEAGGYFSIENPRLLDLGYVQGDATLQF